MRFEYICNSCKHIWVAREGVPNHCPNCSISGKIEKTGNYLQPTACVKCKKEWYPKSKKPKECPFCRTPNWEDEKVKQRKAIFLDRDGTIIYDYQYMCSMNQVKFLPGALNGLKKFQELGFMVFIVVEQTSRKGEYYTEKKIIEINDHITKRLLVDFGILVHESHIYNKSGTNVINHLLKKYNLKAKDCWVVGDEDSNIDLAKNTKCKGLKIGKETAFKTLWQGALHIAKKVGA